MLHIQIYYNEFTMIMLKKFFFHLLINNTVAHAVTDATACDRLRRLAFVTWYFRFYHLGSVCHRPLCCRRRRPIIRSPVRTWYLATRSVRKVSVSLSYVLRHRPPYQTFRIYVESAYRPSWARVSTAIQAPFPATTMNTHARPCLNGGW